MQDHRIPLYARGNIVVAYAIVDAEDFPVLDVFRWGRNNNGYALRSAGAGRVVLMHRQILGLVFGDGLCSDHINREKLDNRRANLRVVTHGQNQQNRRSKPGAASRFRSVFWAVDKSRWRARVRLDGVSYHCGYFQDEVAAAHAAEAFRREHMPFAEPDPELAFIRKLGAVSPRQRITSDGTV